MWNVGDVKNQWMPLLSVGWILMNIYVECK